MVYFSMRSSLIACLVLIFLSFTSTTYASKVVDVGTICKEAKNPSFCSTLLNSKPGGAAGADLISLASYTIEVARSNLTNTVSLIKTLIAQSGKDPNAKSHYQECLLHFGSDEGALGDLDYTQEMLKSGDYMGVNSAASAVISDVDECVSGESPSDPPYHDTSKLPKYVEVVEDVVDIILVLSKLLAQN